MTEEQDEEEKRQAAELSALIEKLHMFAKLQIARLNHEEGVVSASLNRQLKKMMKRSKKVLLLRHQESI